jgi:hypothetical protein
MNAEEQIDLFAIWDEIIKSGLASTPKQSKHPKTIKP